MERGKIKLRFWMDSGVLRQIAECADVWWDKVQAWCTSQSLQIDAETSSLFLLDLLAWQRDVERMPDEDEALYRRRVKHALANAKDAGSRAGFAQIWERLGLGTVKQRERIDAENWDVIEIEIDEAVFGRYEKLFGLLIEKYGRTCRRYIFSSRINVDMLLEGIGFEAENFYCKARG